MSNTPQRRAIVTGGSGDLGGAICRRLAADGAHVIVHANGNLARAEAVRDAILASGGSAQAVAFDVADGDATRAALDALLEEGTIQIVVGPASPIVPTSVYIYNGSAGSPLVAGGRCMAG